MHRELVVHREAIPALLDAYSRGPPAYLLGYWISSSKTRKFIALAVQGRKDRRSRYEYISTEQLDNFQRVKLMVPPFAKNWLNFKAHVDFAEWFKPHMEVYGEQLQRFIASLKVAVIGVGRSGSEIVANLLKEGYRKLILIDKDRVEKRNRHLPVYAKAKEGTPKVDALAKYITQRFSYAEIEPIFGDVTQLIGRGRASSLADADIAFCAVDEIAARAAVSTFCSRMGVPLIELGTSIRPRKGHMPEIAGRISVSIPGRNCLFCMNVLSFQDLTSNQRVRFYGDATFSSLLASKAVLVLKEYLVSSPQTNLYLVSWVMTPRISAHTVPVAQRCPFCRPKYEVRQESHKRTVRKPKLMQSKAQKPATGGFFPLLFLGLLALSLFIWAMVKLPLFKEAVALISLPWVVKSIRSAPKEVKNG